jgi:hypothetical protein
MRSVRILASCLIFSLVLNVVFLVSFLVTEPLDAPVQVVSRSSSAKMATNAHVFETMSHLSFRELVSCLTNREPVEEGFAKRDLAVATLTALHHFNLEKAIAANPSQVRTIAFSPTQSIDLFPGLHDDQFAAIIRYAYQEKWPLTAKGLFLLLKKGGAVPDETLHQAFYVTPEFQALKTLFQKSGAPVPPETLLQLVVEGSWDLLENFANEQTQVVDLSAEKRRALLLNYLGNGSKTAAHLLVHTDFSHSLKRFEDRGILDMLALLDQNDETAKFCKELVSSPRTDAVRKKAASLLGQPLPQTVAAAPVVQTKRSHTVQPGESLWKISREHKVKVDEIVKLNDLEKKTLVPGMVLKIPE